MASKKAPTSKGEVKFSSQDVMKPHSEAKVALYGLYLEKYLAILGVAPGITKINIFDVFCGTGIYKNGKVGSPIVAYNKIKQTRDFLSLKNKIGKPTSLTVNDSNPESIKTASSHLSELIKNDPCCELEFYNLDAAKMIELINTKMSHQPYSERNLIFIDPTGYKEIHRQDLYKLLKAKRSEIVLFLPISFMHRFKGIAQTDFDNPAYTHLRRFISEFFEAVPPPIRMSETMGIHDFIKYVKEALKFDKFYATSFFLKRDATKYYALFFITPNLLGLEKIIDTKWELDPEMGQGFTQGDNHKTQSIQLELFEPIRPSNFQVRMKELEKLIEDFIRQNSDCSNCDLFEYTLCNDFRATHAKQILEEFQKKGLLKIWHVEKKQEVKNFYVNYEAYKSKKATVTYKLI